MEIIVNRISGRNPEADCSLSNVLVKQKGIQIAEFCGLEPDFDKQKQPYGEGKTRIPEGKYRVGLRQDGTMTAEYAERYPWFMGMLHVQDVPNYQYIYIHKGNYPSDTAGCLLVGKTMGKKAVWSSKAAFKELYLLCVASALRGKLTIEYNDIEKI